MLILILLLLAALTGVFWTVVKVTVIAVLVTILFFAVLIYGGIWYVRHRWNRFVKEGQTSRPVGPQTPRGPGRPPRDAMPVEGRKEPDEPLP
jgi:hypothetical protein